MHGEPDARGVGARPLDAMARSGRDEDVVARIERHTCVVDERQLGVSLEQDDPLVAFLLEPLARRSRLTGGDDPLDEDLTASGKTLEALAGRELAWELEQVQTTATSRASESTRSGDPVASSTSRSHRVASPGAKRRSPSRRPASCLPTIPPVSRRSAS